MKNLLFLLCFSFSILNAQNFVQGEWERLPTPEGGRFITDIEVKSSGIIYANANEFRHRYRSFDNGISWERHDFDPHTIGYDGTIIETQYFNEAGISGTQIRFSKDNGVSFEEKFLPRWHPFLSSLSDGKWISNTGSQVFISLDEGDTWEEIYRQLKQAGNPYEIKPDIIMIPNTPSNNIFNGTVINLSLDSSKVVEIPVRNNFSTFERKFTVAPNGTIWVGAESGVAKSDNDGFDWEEVIIDSTNLITRKTTITPLSLIHISEPTRPY